MKIVNFILFKIISSKSTCNLLPLLKSCGKVLDELTTPTKSVPLSLCIPVDN